MKIEWADKGARVTQRSPRTGKETIKHLNITRAQYDNWRRGVAIQHAMPQLNADEREFLMTGLTAEDWEAIFPKGGRGDDD